MPAHASGVCAGYACACFKRAVILPHATGEQLHARLREWKRSGLRLSILAISFNLVRKRAVNSCHYRDNHGSIRCNCTMVLGIQTNVRLSGQSAAVVSLAYVLELNIRKTCRLTGTSG